MVTYLGSLVQLCCGERGTLQKKKKWHVWGLLAVYGPHWVCPSSQRCVLCWSTLLRLHSTLQEHCPTQALHFLHFPGLSHSRSRVLCKGTTRLGVRFLPFPCPSSSGNQVFGKRSPRWAMHLNHLPCRHECTVSGVPCVSSGELISGCDIPGRCQPFRIPGRRG